MTIKELIEIVRFELRRYNFLVEGPISIQRNVIWFSKEPSTCQASFSQDWVQPYIKSFCTEDISEDFVLDRENWHFRIGVRYGHVAGEENGYEIQYRLEIYHFKEPRLVRLTDF